MTGHSVAGLEALVDFDPSEGGEGEDVYLVEGCLEASAAVHVAVPIWLVIVPRYSQPVGAETHIL